MIDTLNPAFTAGTQWFERTLDDSATTELKDGATVEFLYFMGGGSF